MVIFHCYVSSPKGRPENRAHGSEIHANVCLLVLGPSLPWIRLLNYRMAAKSSQIDLVKSSFPTFFKAINCYHQISGKAISGWCHTYMYIYVYIQYIPWCIFISPLHLPSAGCITVDWLVKSTRPESPRRVVASYQLSAASCSQGRCHLPSRIYGLR